MFTLRVNWLAAIVAGLMAACCGCERSVSDRARKGAVPMSIVLTSQAFADGQPIPVKYTGEGDDISPPLHWDGAPAETEEFVLICDDPDAPREEPWVHWVIYKIHANIDSLPEGVKPSPRPPVPAGMLQGLNSWPKVGYGGPMPPKGHGPHRYFFKIYALDTELDIEPELTKEALLEAMQGHIIAEGQLMGTYERK